MLPSKQVVRKVAVFAADISIFYFSCLFFILTSLEEMEPLLQSPGHLLQCIIIFHMFLLVFQLGLRTYDSLWRYAAHREYLTLLAGLLCGTLLYDLSHYGTTVFPLDSNFIWAVASLSGILMLAMRFFYRMYRERRRVQPQEEDNRKPVAIVGAGSAGLMLFNECTINSDSRFRPVCFFDDDPEKQSKRIQGVPVRGTIADIPKILADSDIRHIFVAMPSQSEDRIAEALRICTQVRGITVPVLPGSVATTEEHTEPIGPQLRKVDITDLLGRKQIKLKDTVVSGFLSDKIVLVTGGGGSIGSELCRQIAANHPKQLIIIDIYENNAYDLQQELARTYGDSLNLVVEIASVRDGNRIEAIFQQYHPEIVLHAAAHKHVPLMEHSPQEAVRNNIFGTRNVVLAAHRAGVKKFVQISTDKAVNPTNVMGATKRMCEMMEQGMSQISDTDFVAVRFGNVLGSNGSVIPLFTRQIAQGGPITLTDKRIIRYFMTIPEAAQLVLQAGAMAAKNQVYVLDMGGPVKILELAENLIRLSGLEPYRDIDIQEIGLRPGEKLYEELLIGGNTINTDHKMIFIEEQPPISQQEIMDKLALLQIAVDSGDKDVIITALRTAVPTFRTPDEVNRDFAASAEESVTAT